jgi:hypothetical protein
MPLALTRARKEQEAGQCTGHCAFKKTQMNHRDKKTSATKRFCVIRNLREFGGSPKNRSTSKNLAVIIAAMRLIRPPSTPPTIRPQHEICSRGLGERRFNSGVGSERTWPIGLGTPPFPPEGTLRDARIEHHSFSGKLSPGRASRQAQLRRPYSGGLSSPLRRANRLLHHFDPSGVAKLIATDPVRPRFLP